MHLILVPKTKINGLIEKLRSKIEQETVLVYKFPKLSRPEIENMFTLSDLKNTRVYKNAKQEGIEIGEVSMLKRILSKKVRNLSPNISDQINNLNRTQLESLSEVIFDLENPSQL